MSKYTELWNKIKNLIQTINGKPCKYEKRFIKIKLDSDDNLPLGKILKLHNLTIVGRSVFQVDNKYYPQFFLDECSYEFKKCCITIKLTLQKEFKLTNQINQENA